MGELAKIKDVSTNYAVTARTLRYYEDVGILTSIRSEDYAHRLYDEAAITRLKQILILRKLNVSVKNIKRIFAASGSEVVLEVLGKKAEDIDDELALLHELKGIVLEFIRQIKQSDFHNDSDVKLLYDKAKEIETQLTASGHNENTPNVNKLLEVTEKLDDRQTAPIIVNAYRQSLPPTRFIGIKHNSGGAAWDNWGDSHGELLKNLPGVKGLYEDGNSLIGLMNHRNGFEYWLGYFTPENTQVPEGFQYEDFPPMEIGSCWIYKHEDYPEAELAVPAYEKLREEGFDADEDWWFERYHPVRHESDKKGYVIFDMCFFPKGWR